MSIRAHIYAALYLCKLKRKIVKQICIPSSSNISSDDQIPIHTQKEVKRNSITLLEEIPWDIDIVKKSFLIYVNEKSKKEAESLLLDQYVNGSWKPLGFWSKAFTKPQQSYTTYRRELMAIQQAMRHFNSQFNGRHLIRP